VKTGGIWTDFTHTQSARSQSRGDWVRGW
jgi:hypothetical protein